MAKRKRRPAKQKQAAKKQPLSNVLQPDPDVLTYNYLADKDLTDIDDVEQVLEDFLHDLEMDYFLQWDAVMRKEQRLPLNSHQKNIVDELISEQERPTDRILYIGDMPRPKQMWYELVQILASNLVTEQPLKPASDYFPLFTQGWPRLAEQLKEQAPQLSHPHKVRSWGELIPAEMHHRLWVQYCFTQFVDVGNGLSLADEEGQPRLDWFIRCLTSHKASLNYFDLTLEALLANIILPPAEADLITQTVLTELNLESPQEPLAKHL